MDLGNSNNSQTDQQVDAVNLHKNFFFSSPLQASSSYLVSLEGPAIAAGIQREEEKFILLFGSETGATRYLKSSTHAEAVSLMRELVTYYRDKFKSADPSAFNLRPGVARLSRFLQPAGVVRALRDLHHFLCSGLDSPQIQLWYHATRDVTADCDRFNVRSAFRGDIELTRQLIKQVGLEEHDQYADIESAIYKWIQSWAKLPLLPRITDDFAFLAFFCEALVELPELEEEDYRALIVSLTDAAVARGGRAISDSRFELLRASARAARRIPFCQFLLKQHGRSLDLLGYRMKAWVMIGLLLGDSQEELKRFRHALRLDTFSRDLELDQEELRSFMNSIIAKARPFRERYELDWLSQMTEALATMLGAQRQLARLSLDESSSVEALASQLASEAPTKISSTEMKALLAQITRIVEQSLVVAGTQEESSAVFIEYFTPLVGTRHANLAFRNLSRLCIVLAEQLAESWKAGEERLRQMAQHVAQLKLPATNDQSLIGQSLAALRQHELIVLSEINVALTRPSRMEREMGLCEFLRNESAQGRLDNTEIANLSAKVEDDPSWNRLITRDVGASLKHCLAQVAISFSLLDDQQERETFAEALNPWQSELAKLRKYFYLFGAHSITRLDEEFQIWLAPKLRSVVEELDDSALMAWPRAQAMLIDGLPESLAQRMESLVYRTTGYRSAKAGPMTAAVSFNTFSLSALEDRQDRLETTLAFQRFVDRFAQGVVQHRNKPWLRALIDHLKHSGDEERAWFTSRSLLIENLRTQGYGVFSRELDAVINDLPQTLGGIEASHWIEFLAEGRAYLQFLMIGISLTDNHDLIAVDAMKGMQSLQSHEKHAFPSTDSIAQMLRGFGTILLEQTPSLIAFDQARFWTQEILSSEQQSKAFWRLLFIHIRDATAEMIPEEMVVTLGSWANRIGSTIESLNAFKDTSRSVFDPQRRSFAEAKDDEYRWKNAFAGIMVVSVAEESGRLPRAWLAQQWYESRPEVRQLDASAWEQVSAAFEKKLEQEADPWFMPGYYSMQREIATKLADKAGSGQSLTTDEHAFVKRRHSGHARQRWQNYAAVMSQQSNAFQSTFMTVAKLTGWPLLAAGEVELQNKDRQKRFTQTLAFSPQQIKLGLLRKRPPAIAKNELNTFQSRTLGLVLGAMNGDLCCQIQCMFNLKMGPLKGWDHKEFQAFIQAVLNADASESKQKQAVNSAWVASVLAGRRKEIASSVVGKWSPYGRQGAQNGMHERCERDLGHLLAQLMYQVVGLSGLQTLDQWYQRHVLEFIGDRALEPFAQLVAALRSVLKRELPQEAFNLASVELEPLETLLNEGS